METIREMMIEDLILGMDKKRSEKKKEFLQRQENSRKALNSLSDSALFEEFRQQTWDEGYDEGRRGGDGNNL